MWVYLGWLVFIHDVVFELDINNRALDTAIGADALSATMNSLAMDISVALFRDMEDSLRCSVGMRWTFSIALLRSWMERLCAWGSAFCANSERGLVAVFLRECGGSFSALSFTGERADHGLAAAPAAEVIGGGLCFGIVMGREQYMDLIELLTFAEPMYRMALRIGLL